MLDGVVECLVKRNNTMGTYIARFFMFLLDGIPAIYFDKEFSEETLVACVHQILDLFAPNLILGISDEISSTGDIERIRLVGKIVDEYNLNAERAVAEQ